MAPTAVLSAGGPLDVPPTAIEACSVAEDFSEDCSVCPLTASDLDQVTNLASVEGMRLKVADFLPRASSDPRFPRSLPDNPDVPAAHEEAPLSPVRRCPIRFRM